MRHFVTRLFGRRPTNTSCANSRIRHHSVRFQSSASNSQQAADAASSAHFWTTTRVLLLTAFTGSLTYLYGIRDTSSYLHQKLAPAPKPSKPVFAEKKVLEHAITELREALGEDGISTDDEDLQRHGYSEWSSINIDQLPVAVAYPKSTEEVSQIAKCCHKHKIPIVPYSGGSSLEANFSAPFGGVSVDFTFMDKILKLRPDDMDVTLQPAVGWMSLNEQIQDSGLFFPVDPGPSAMIGGMVGTSCSGTNAVRYGTMKDWVVNLTVVLADGTVIKTKRRPRLAFTGTIRSEEKTTDSLQEICCGLQSH